MDSAEGSYTQIYDHFGDQESVDKIIGKIRLFYITHLHGDHCFGMWKLIQERDRVMHKRSPDERTKLYVTIPDCILGCLTYYKTQNYLKHPELLEIMPCSLFNPEQVYYYQDGYV